MAHYLDPKNDLTFKKLHELWLRFLTEINESTLEVPTELLKDDHIREAIGYVERAAYTKEQLQTYDKWKINMLTERGMIDDAREEGKIEGKIEGKMEGRVEEKHKIALSMLKDGMSVEIVCKYTGLTGQQIEAIKKG